jgi:hypothetical protein
MMICTAPFITENWKSLLVYGGGVAVPGRRFEIETTMDDPTATFWPCGTLNVGGIKKGVGEVVRFLSMNEGNT